MFRLIFVALILSSHIFDKVNGRHGVFPTKSNPLCPSMQFGDEIVELVMKYLPANHPAAQLPHIVASHYQLYCALPACLSFPCMNSGSCNETMEGFLCTCTSHYIGSLCDRPRPSDCKVIYDSWKQVSGVYTVYTNGDNLPVDVYCDMDTDGGGWLVVQRRMDGSVDFFLYWEDYKAGFGNLTGEFWLGNDNIHNILKRRLFEVRFDLSDFEGQTRYAKYSTFGVQSEAENYKLTIEGYQGDAGDSMQFHSGHEFSTRDRENNVLSFLCAGQGKGGWWYSKCHRVNINGRYLSGPFTSSYEEGISWYGFQGPWYSLNTTEMKLRPIH